MHSAAPPARTKVSFGLGAHLSFLGDLFELLLSSSFLGLCQLLLLLVLDNEHLCVGLRVACNFVTFFLSFSCLLEYAR